MWGAASQRAHKRVYKHLLMLARWLTKQDNDVFLSWKLIFLWWNSMYTFSTVDVWLKYIRVHRVYSHIWPSRGRRAGYQVWWFSREGRWCCTDPSWSQVCNYGDSRRPTTRKLWSGRMTIIRIKERKKKKNCGCCTLLQLRSWVCGRVYRVGLFPGLVDQLLDLRDVPLQIVLQLFDWLQLLQQPIGLILQIFDFSSSSVDWEQREE